MGRALDDSSNKTHQRQVEVAVLISLQRSAQRPTCPEIVQIVPGRPWPSHFAQAAGTTPLTNGGPRFPRLNGLIGRRAIRGTRQLAWNG